MEIKSAGLPLCGVALWQQRSRIVSLLGGAGVIFIVEESKCVSARVQGLVSNHVCKLKLKIEIASEMTKTELRKIPPCCLLTFQGKKSTVDSPVLGCSQQEGVATCLLSVLIRPSCGPTLVDFSEITWHPHCRCHRGCSASAGLPWSAWASSSSCCLYPLHLQEKGWAG